MPVTNNNMLSNHTDTLWWHATLKPAESLGTVNVELDRVSRRVKTRAKGYRQSVCPARDPVKPNI